MPIKNKAILVLYMLPLWFAFASRLHATVIMEWVMVGDAGNAADSTGYGAVSYAYNIGKYEVTNAQYADFLNSKAASDPNGLYNTNMGSTARGGITRSGSSGNYTYAVKAGYELMPVNFVNFLDAQRFSNWLHNGQGNGDTETGAYATVGVLISHDINATVWIPTENEWYKAAFYQPVGMGGDMDSYWLYPTQSNSRPTSATPPSSILGAANYLYDDFLNNGVNGGYAVTQTGVYSNSINYLSEVGAYANSASYYGTYDQGGNVWEWNEAFMGGTDRGLRGSAFDFGEASMRATNRPNFDSLLENDDMGFRLASAVPEPSRAMLMLIGGCLLLIRRSRRSTTID